MPHISNIGLCLWRIQCFQVLPAHSSTLETQESFLLPPTSCNQHSPNSNHHQVLWILLSISISSSTLLNRAVVSCLNYSNSFQIKSMGFPKQEYCSGLPFPSSGGLPSPGMEPGLLHWQGDFFFFFTAEPPGKPFGSWVLLKRQQGFVRAMPFTLGVKTKNGGKNLSHFSKEIKEEKIKRVVKAGVRGWWFPGGSMGKESACNAGA